MLSRCYTVRSSSRCSDPSMFAKATVDRELGTVVWANGADLSPEFLYAGEEWGEPHPK